MATSLTKEFENCQHHGPLPSDDLTWQTQMGGALESGTQLGWLIRLGLLCQGLLTLTLGRYDRPKLG